MKRHTFLPERTGLWLAAFLAVIGCTSGLAQSTPTGSAAQGRESRPTNANSALVQPMTQMASQMKSARKTGDPDMDYATLTKIHHQSEIDLIQQGLKSGKNPELMTFMRNLVPEKEKDLAELNQLSRELTAASTNPSFSQEINQKLNAMDMDTQKGMNGRMTGDADKDLIATMIQHHQDGIDLSQTYLKYAKNPTLRAHAERMVANSQREIEAMKQIIK